MNSIFELASEFFYEIRRFIPGLALIAFYFQDEAEDALCKRLGLSIAVIIIIAWLLGLVIDALTSFVVHGFYVAVGWLNQKFAPLDKKGPQDLTLKRLYSVLQWLLNVTRPPETEIDKLVKGDIPVYMANTEVPPGLKTQIARGGALSFAERQVSRNLCCVFLISALCPPKSFLGLAWHCYCGVIGAVAFGFSWLSPCVLRHWDEKRGAIGLVILGILFLAGCALVEVRVLW
ncbi:MAG TPA: hypothetical protein VGJ73_15235 [Verrucomicrobiae bacterium]|jgi:hypothetical protein